MNNTSCPRVSFDFTGRFLPPVLILVFIVGLVANAWGLNSLRQNWKKLGSVNVFVLNLGLADVLYLLTLPFLVVYYIKANVWIFGATFCKITRFCFNLNLYGSIGFLTCITVYRYLAIVHPIKVLGRITVTHSVNISVLVWLLVAAQSLPDVFYIKTSRNRTESCYETTHSASVEDYLNYSLGRTLTGFCIPLLITLGCYGHMIITLCSKNKSNKDVKRRIVRLMFILILLFSVCYIPYHLFKNLNLWSRVLSKHGKCHRWSNGVYIAHQISRGLVCLNSTLNPLVLLNARKDSDSALTAARRAIKRLFIPTVSQGVNEDQQLHHLELGRRQL
ncbi:P2Y purinoceptor 1-like [Platichthys flesus]|uniref:P2Y purinoceptor 1-like n=1 Tax=Platichthys flesus TaxID=8260 RepID=UPI002DBD699C|nr:P2Y purinoceptor 1-like [Platichthys flesus]